MIKFNIVTTCYNADQWINNCIQSIRDQSYENWNHFVVDDCSTDKTWDTLKALKGDNNTKLKIGQPSFKAGNLFNQWQVLTWFNLEHDSVVIHLDGDDWLHDKDVLVNLKSIYENIPDVLVTYGNYITTDGSPSVCAEKPANETYRDGIFKGWKYSHLRTYRKKLFNNIKEADLKDSKGNFFQYAPDVAIFLPILEMAGERVHFCKRINSVYNRHTTLNEDKVNLGGQVQAALEIYSKPSYSRVE